MVTFDAADYGVIPGTISLNGKRGRAVTGAGDVTFEFWDGSSDHWPRPSDVGTSMDRTVKEIVDWLDGNTEFTDTPGDSLHTLEVIAACHVSHQRNASWTSLPLNGNDRQLVVGSG